MASDESTAIQKPEEVVIELPAPPGWKKTYNPRKSGTPKRYQIVFTSPSGEEIKSKSQLDKYLKSHPGGPAASEFDWSTGETPRRSNRISSKVKATESPEDEPPSKRSRSKKAAKAEADKTDDEEKDAEEKEVSEPAEEIKSSEVAKMQDVENVEQMEKGDISSGELMAGHVPTSEEKVEAKPEIPEQQKSALEEFTLIKEQESTLARGGPMSEEKVDVNTAIQEQPADAFGEFTLQMGQESTLAGDGPEEKLEANTTIQEQHGDAIKESTQALMSVEKFEGNSDVQEQHGDAFKESTLEEEQNSTLAGDAPMAGPNIELKTEILEQHKDAFEDCTSRKDQISISSVEVPETNESKGADITLKGPEDFQEARTFLEANEVGTVHGTLQIAGESVVGAQDHLAESKASVPEDVVGMEKSFLKDGEVGTNPSAEDASLRNQTM